MEDDEDTVMGDGGLSASQLASEAGRSHSSLGKRPATDMNGDPSFPPTLLRPSKQHSSNVKQAISTEVEVEAEGFSPPKVLAKSVEVEDSNAEYHEKADSIVEENSDWSEEAAASAKGIPTASLPTGLCYDIRMRYHCEVRPTTDVHPEDPRRIYYIYKELCRAGLVDDPESLRPLAAQPLERIPVRDATAEEISLVHDPDHYAFVESTKDMTDDMLIELEHTRDSIYFNSLTFASSLLSVGGAIETCMAVATRRVKNAIAVIRPPGHHAEHNKTMGFCLFNNVSVAARVCQKELGEKCRKIMILDWDVHHGNGIQKAFYDDPNVLYISLHVYNDGKFYPGGNEGDLDHCGEGPGLGRNVNIPWPSQGMGDGDYLFAFQQVIMPIASEFDPDFVIIASGFDAAAGDELGGCFVSPPCYAHMTHMLMTLANGKLAVCLEGGYNFRAISKSALAVTKTLMGEPPERLSATAPSRPAVHAVRRVMMAQSKFWKCMYPKEPREDGLWTDRVHDVIRIYQSKHLYDNYKLTSLYIYRTAISKSFENQVLATSNYDQAVPLIVIFHDPPEIMGIPNPSSNKLEPHNCWLVGANDSKTKTLANKYKADVVKDYIEWAVRRNYAVIDVNIPKYVTSDSSPGKYEDEDENRPTATEELAGYLWDNYIEPNEATEIFFLGIGDAFYGVANLLINRDSIYQRVNSIISFVAENPVRAIASHTQVWLSRWYKENSLVYVSHTHGVWSNFSRKPSKRYGRLIRSEKAGLSEMLEFHKEDVFKWIDSRTSLEESDESEKDEGSRSPTKEK